MPSSRKRSTKAIAAGERKVSKTYRLTPRKLEAARRILGTATTTEAIETALDMVVFRQELIDGTRAMLGVDLAAPDENAG